MNIFKILICLIWTVLSSGTLSAWNKVWKPVLYWQTGKQTNKNYAKTKTKTASDLSYTEEVILKCIIGALKQCRMK